MTDQGPAAQIRLGYLPNVTHATALIGMRKGFFAKELGQTGLTRQLFGAGQEEVSALLGGSLDVAFIGPGPAINAYVKSHGQAVRLVAGATLGGAQLVVRQGITSLNGKTVASPQMGNTQDIALKKWLRDQSFDDVKIINSDNPQTFAAFRDGGIDAAWVPEPWSSRLVLEAGGQVLVNEKELWPQGRFSTTVILVRTQFLQEHRQTVQALLRGVIRTNEWTRGNESEARAVVNDELAEHVGQPLPAPVIERAFREIELSTDPLAGHWQTLAENAVIAGVATDVPDLTGFVDLSVLDEVRGTQSHAHVRSGS